MTWMSENLHRYKLKCVCPYNNNKNIRYELYFCFFFKNRESSSGGVLCGVMRIGLVAKGLLIKGDMDLELVLMCRDKPTQTLLDTVCHNLPTQIEVSHTHTHI